MRNLLFLIILIPFSTFSQTNTNTLSPKNNQTESSSSQTSTWNQFLTKRLNLENIIENGVPAGKYKVIVSFMVNQEGNITNITPITHFGYGMEEEVIRVLKSSPRWKSENDNKVLTKMILPINMFIETDSVNIKVKGEDFVLYQGIENEIQIENTSFKDQEIKVEIENGSVKKQNNNYIVDVSSVQEKRVLMKIFLKNGALIQQVSFEIKPKSEAKF
ncbi:MAG: hypothetical protein QM535_09835 [Limnohabitans sp.]|nr:hypothetical protein [Limnohabitans sp.]